jgi:hypothetical protein
MGNKHMLEIVDNLHAPEIYASEITGYTIGHGNVTLTLASSRASWNDQGVPNKRVVVGRMVLSLSAAQALSVELFGFLRNHGLDPTKKVEVRTVESMAMQ